MRNVFSLYSRPFLFSLTSLCFLFAKKASWTRNEASRPSSPEPHVRGVGVRMGPYASKMVKDPETGKVGMCSALLGGGGPVEMELSS